MPEYVATYHPFFPLGQSKDKEYYFNASNDAEAVRTACEHLDDEYSVIELSFGCGFVGDPPETPEFPWCGFVGDPPPPRTIIATLESIFQVEGKERGRRIKL